MPDHNASENMLGYLYQVKYALVLLLDTDFSDAQISIEKFDDVAFNSPDTSSPLEMIQLKHHVGTHNSGNLTDRSVDLWRTLKVWIDAVNADCSLLDSTYFSIITTATAPDGSIASELTDRVKNRKVPDVEKIYNRMKNICTSSTSQSNASYYKAFLDADEADIKKLLSRIAVIDSAPNALDCDREIRKYVRYNSLPKNENKVIDRIEGFWFKSMISALCSPTPVYMSQNQMRAKIVSIAQEYANDNLPIDIDFEEIERLAANSPQDKIFCEQLRLIGHNSRRIQIALRDYFQACSQRANWIRDGLVYINDLDEYERKLKEEWEHCFADMEVDLDEQADEQDKKKAGRNLLHEIEDKDIRIRSKCDEAFIMRGSYHILADKLDVGWHIDFYERLKHLLDIG